MKLHKFIFVAVLVIIISVAANAAEELTVPVKLTIMYDNQSGDDPLQAAGGFSCLVEIPSHAILFDAGSNPIMLAGNFRKLNADPDRIDTVVISHMHFDHFNGLRWLVRENNHLSILLPESASQKAIKALGYKPEAITLVSETRSICEGIFTTGTMPYEIPEQALYIDTVDGIVVVTGCSHLGIVRILKKVKELSGKEIYLVLGGFHLRDSSREQVEKTLGEIKALGVKKVGPAHCTGGQAVKMFQNLWGENCVPMGVGKKLQFNLKKRP